MGGSVFLGLIQNDPDAMSEYQREKARKAEEKKAREKRMKERAMRLLH